jgi:tRNA threonylcarbamoyladenosine modification (KEOPS) complex  Pcc1 subunit
MGLVIVSLGCGNDNGDCSSGQVCWKDGSIGAAGGRDGVSDIRGPVEDAAPDAQVETDIGAEVAVVDLGVETGRDVSSPDVAGPDASAADAPSADAPAADALSVDAPAADAFSVDAPAADALSVDAPVADALSADAPAADALSGKAPAADALFGDTPPDDSLVGDLRTADATTPKEVADLRANADSSGNANLRGLAVSAGQLYPRFDASTTSYSIYVSSDLFQVTITPTADESGSIVVVNGQAVASGQASSDILLFFGSNTITIMVTAPDLATTKTYTITITRAVPLSSNANLHGLTLSAGTLSPAFDASTRLYSASTNNAVTSVAITPTAEEADATITVNGQRTLSGHATSDIPLNIGSNTITAIVTAPDLITTKTYKVTIVRADPLSSNADLHGLAISAGTLSPSFDAATTSYSSSVANTVSSVAITPTAEESDSVIAVNGQAVTSGQPSSGISLSVGDNAITIVVTAPDSTTTKTYTVTVTRAEPLSNNADLGSLAISSGSLSPTFDSSVTSYTASVVSSCSSVTVTPTRSGSGATIAVNGTSVASGTGMSVNLNSGANTITIVVTAEDTSAAKTTTITVNREISCEQRLTVVDCMSASCLWLDGTCITPGTGPSPCESMDEDACNAAPDCLWIGICIGNEP